MPTEEDINRTVLTVLRKLVRLVKLEPSKLKPVLREVDQIVAHTTFRGRGNGIRHELERVDVKFVGVGGVTSKSNPRLRFFKPLLDHLSYQPIGIWLGRKKSPMSL